MSGWLTTAELTAMQNVIYNGVLPDTCVIQAPTYTSDGAGGQSASYAPVTGGTVLCRRDPHRLGNTLEVIAGAEAVVYDDIFTLPVTAPIAVDRVIIHNGDTCQIRQISDHPSWILCRRAFTARIE